MLQEFVHPSCTGTVLIHVIAVFNVWADEVSTEGNNFRHRTLDLMTLRFQFICRFSDQICLTFTDFYQS